MNEMLTNNTILMVKLWEIQQQDNPWRPPCIRLTAAAAWMINIDALMILAALSWTQTDGSTIFPPADKSENLKEARWRAGGAELSKVHYGGKRGF